MKETYNYRIEVLIEGSKERNQTVIDSLITLFELKVKTIIVIKDTVKLNVTKIEGKAAKAKEMKNEFQRVRDRLQHKE